MDGHDSSLISTADHSGPVVADRRVYVPVETPPVREIFDEIEQSLFVFDRICNRKREEEEEDDRCKKENHTRNERSFHFRGKRFRWNDVFLN